MSRDELILRHMETADARLAVLEERTAQILMEVGALKGRAAAWGAAAAFVVAAVTSLAALLIPLA